MNVAYKRSEEEDMKEINENEATFVSKITSLTTSFPRWILVTLHLCELVTINHISYKSVLSYYVLHILLLYLLLPTNKICTIYKNSLSKNNFYNTSFVILECYLMLPFLPSVMPFQKCLQWVEKQYLNVTMTTKIPS